MHHKNRVSISREICIHLNPSSPSPSLARNTQLKRNFPYYTLKLDGVRKSSNGGWILYPLKTPFLPSFPPPLSFPPLPLPLQNSRLVSESNSLFFPFIFIIRRIIFRILGFRTRAFLSYYGWVLINRIISSVSEIDFC